MQKKVGIAMVESMYPATTADARRSLLLANMQELKSQGISCRACVGTCCTSAANSMQITAEEAQDIWWFLHDSQQLNSELIGKLHETVGQYRLDRPVPGDGVRTFIRRTYTCPVYDGDSGWCQLPPTVKPYGCLAFNPKKAGNVAGEFCGSSQQLLDEQATLNRGIEPQAGGTLSVSLEQDRLSIPLALLSIIERFDERAKDLRS
jgi:hypothetical protein